MDSGVRLLDNKKSPPSPWKGTRATRVATLIDLFITNKSTCLITAFQPATTYYSFSCATPGRIHKCFYRLAPPAGSLEKTELVTTSHHRFICEIKHTLLHDVTFGKHLFTLEKQLAPKWCKLCLVYTDISKLILINQ